MALLLRYQTAASRDLTRSLSELIKLRKEARRADRDESEPADEAGRRNEANATEVQVEEGVKRESREPESPLRRPNPLANPNRRR